MKQKDISAHNMLLVEQLIPPLLFQSCKIKTIVFVITHLQFGKRSHIVNIYIVNTSCKY